MEFETSSKEKTDGISDEMRLAASSRKTVITPIHEDIYADEESDELIATQHTLAPPIANIPSDTEATTAYTDANTQAGQKTQKTHPKKRRAVRIATPGSHRFSLRHSPDEKKVASP